MENTKKLFWNIPLKTFINWEYSTRRSEKSYFETLQQIQEDAFDNWSLYDQEHEIDDDDIEQATKYIKQQVKKELSKQSKITLDDYIEEIKSDIHRAKSDAYAGNYQNEFLKEYWKLIHDAITKTAGEIGKKGGEIIITNGKEGADLSRDIKPEFWEANMVKIETTPEELAKFCNKAKIDDKNHLKQEIVKKTADIRKLLAEYSTDKDYNSQILRQIGSIEAIVNKTI